MFLDFVSWTDLAAAAALVAVIGFCSGIVLGAVIHGDGE